MTPTHDQNIKAESFIFRELAAPVDKKKAARRRRDPKNTRPFYSQPIIRTQSDLDQIEQEDNDPVSSAQRATVLSNVHVYIDKTLYNDQRIGAMALSLGATVAETLDSSVTHVIHGPTQQYQQQQQQQPQQTPTPGVNSSNNNNMNKQRHPRLVTQALERGMRVVSPTWIFECYEQKQRLPEQFYPYNVDTACRLSYQQPQPRNHHRHYHGSSSNDNVFGLPQSEINSSDTDDDDKTDDGCGGLGLREEADEEADVKNENTHIEGYDTPHGAIPSSMSSPIATATAPVVTSSSEDMARLEKRMKRSAEIAKLKDQKKRQRQQQRQKHTKDDQEIDDDSLDQNSPPLPEGDGMRNALLAGRERVEIWYGEQSFYHDTTAFANAQQSGQQRGLSLSNKSKGKQ